MTHLHLIAWLAALAVLGGPAGFIWCCCGPPPPPYTVCFNLLPYGCNGTSNLVPGLTVAISGPWGIATSALTSASPARFCGLGPGTYSYTITGHPRFATKTGTFVISSPTDNNGTLQIALSPATGYHCFCAGLTYPVADTLYLSGPGISGTVTLTWLGSYWEGSGTFNYSGSGCCGLLSGGSQSVTWRMCQPLQPRLQWTYTNAAVNNCPGAGFTVTQGTNSGTATESPAFSATFTPSDPFGAGSLFDGLGTGPCNATVTYTATE